MGSNFFSKASSVQVFAKSPHFDEGSYIVELGNIKLIESNDKKKEFIVISTLLKAVKNAGPKAPTVGQEPAQVYEVPGNHDLGAANWKQFLCACLDIDIDNNELSDDEWLELSDGVLNGDLEGTTVELKCHIIQTRKGDDFTIHTWKGVPSPETLASYGL